MDRKPVDQLLISDLSRFPVWQFVDNETYGVDETMVEPVRTLPVDHLQNRVVGTQVRLANGINRWAIIGNVSLNSPKQTKHFLTMSIEHDGKWFHLARYHDVDWLPRGPEALAASLGLAAQDVFPISFDLSGKVPGNSGVLCGTICQNPSERLSSKELIALALEES